MTIVWTALGIVLIALVVQDVFTVLFRPGAGSRVSAAIALVLGWALIYLPHYPQEYVLADGSDARFALAAAMPVLTEIAQRGTADGLPDSVRLRAEMLDEAIDDLTSTVVERFVLHRRHDIADAIAAFALDHRHGTATAAREQQRPGAERAVS